MGREKAVTIIFLTRSRGMVILSCWKQYRSLIGKLNDSSLGMCSISSSYLSTWRRSGGVEGAVDEEGGEDDEGEKEKVYFMRTLRRGS